MKRKNKLAQSAIEFLILVGAVLFFIIIFIYAVQSNITGKVVEEINIAIKEIAFTLQDEINLAAESVDGYYREFKLPEKALNKDYEISIIDGFVHVKTFDEKYALSLPIQDVVGQPKVGLNAIKKENGTIYLNIFE